MLEVHWSVQNKSYKVDTGAIESVVYRERKTQIQFVTANFNSCLIISTKITQYSVSFINVDVNQIVLKLNSCELNSKNLGINKINQSFKLCLNPKSKVPDQ